MPYSRVRDAERKRTFFQQQRASKLADVQAMADARLALALANATPDTSRITSDWVLAAMLALYQKASDDGAWASAIKALQLVGQTRGLWLAQAVGDTPGGVTVNVQVNLLPTDSAAKLVRSIGNTALSDATESGAETGIVVRTIKEEHRHEQV